MYAVIETGGKQYKVSPGEVIKIEKIKGECGSSIEFDKVHLFVDEGKVTCGEKVINTKVKGTILSEGKGKKVIVFKFKKRKNYRRKLGHRQYYTSVRVDEIISN